LKGLPESSIRGGKEMGTLYRLIVVAVVFVLLATGLSQAVHVISPLAMVARHLTSSVSISNSSGPTPAMYVAIRAAAALETNGDMHVDRIDYVGRHENGPGSVGYIFYIYFADSSGLGYERFVRVLRTGDGTLQVLTA
jgi:hypothetical protein